MEPGHSTTIWLVRLVLLGSVLVRGIAGRSAAPAEPEPGKEPKYPRETIARTYEADPHWPRDPLVLTWAAVPGVAVDAEDHVYVFVRAKPPVRVYSPEGVLLRTWGDEHLHTAHHLKIDHEGNVWAADIGLHVVRKFTPTGELLLTLGTPGKPGEDASHFDQPTDMAIARDGQVFVSDGYGNNRVVQFDAQGKFVRAWGEMGTRPGEFSLPHAIALAGDGLLYVADRNNVRVQIFDQSGQYVRAWNDLVVPWGFCVTQEGAATGDRAAGGRLWICGSSPMGWRERDVVLGCPPKDQLFMCLDTEGRVRQLWTVPRGDGPTAPPGALDWVHCLAVDSRGAIYAGDIMGQRIQKFVPRR